MLRLTTLIIAATLGWASPAAAERGILLLAHGAHSHATHGHGDHGGPWNANVQSLAARLDERRPTEVAFGMADPAAIQAAIERLEGRGVTEIVTVPLFVSSHSPIIGNFRYILGLQDHLARTTALKHLDRVASGARISFVGAMDAHPLISAILLERALASTDDPARTSLVLIAHGPNTAEENELWLRDMVTHAEFLKARGGFRDVVALTHRNDAPAPVKAGARARFREAVAAAGRDGKAVVVPLLLSRGGIEAQVEADLSGLAYTFAEPLMPHPKLEEWIAALAGL